MPPAPELLPEPLLELLPELLPEPLPELPPELLPELPPVLLPELLPELLLVLAPELLPEPLVELVPEPLVEPLLEPPLADPPLLVAPPDDPPDDPPEDDAAPPLLAPPEPAPLLPPFEGLVVLDPHCARMAATAHSPTAEKYARSMVSTSRGAHHRPPLARRASEQDATSAPRRVACEESGRFRRGQPGAARGVAP